MADWYYMRGDERVGPVTEDQLRSRRADGDISAEALVWADGLPNWICAKDAPELNRTSGSASVAVQPTYPTAAVAVQPLPAMTPVAYFTPAGGLPPRAATNLRGHAAPQGDVGDWPLDDLRVSQFEEALRIRRRITGAASLYRALLLLGLIVATGFLIGTIVNLADSHSRARAEALSTGIFTVVMLGICALYYAAFRATMRSQRWAPLTMFILFLAGIAMSLFGTMVTFSAAPAGPNIVGTLFSLIFGGWFAVVSWRSFAAIPKYLAQPAWCQELMATAKL